MANYNKNLFVGIGGSEAINLSHFIGAVGAVSVFFTSIFHACPSICCISTLGGASVNQSTLKK